MADVFGLLDLPRADIGGEHVHFVTPAKAVDALLSDKTLSLGDNIKQGCVVLEPCCGTGSICDAIRQAGGLGTLYATDIVERDGMSSAAAQCFERKDVFAIDDDFLLARGVSIIITNPPWGARVQNRVVSHLVDLSRRNRVGLALLLPVSSLSTRWFSRLIDQDTIPLLRFLTWRPNYTLQGGTAPQRFSSVWCVWQTSCLKAIDWY